MKDERRLYTELVRKVGNAECVVFDLDDTLCAPDWELHWEKCDQFDAIPAMVELARMVKNHGYDVVIATARPSTHLVPTLKWLEQHFPEWNALYMANAEVDAEAHDAKEQQLLAIEKFWDIQFWVDDSPANCEVIQEHGVVCLRPTRNDEYWNNVKGN
jgi:hydroxymethylpyrimidine pyrophosphatase-like HAD family hydrolase